MNWTSRRNALLMLGASGLRAGSLAIAPLQAELNGLAQRFDGRLGIGVRYKDQTLSVRGQERFSLQSVMKLMVGFAALEAIDRGLFARNKKILFRREDLSLAHQPIEEKLGPHGYETTPGELIRLGVVESDSAAADYLIRMLGSPAKVTEAMRSKGVMGLRIDRDERNLQCDILGLRWKQEYVDAKVLERETKAVAAQKRAAAYAAYMKDVRDTSTPIEMLNFLTALSSGKLLSKESTAFLMQAMKDCITGEDRLRAGLPKGWTVAHKTGTAGGWEGLFAALNDVGYLIAPNGEMITVAVFAGDSRAKESVRAAAIANVAAAVAKHFH